MCGLTAIFSADQQRQIQRQTLEAMTSALSHRGPDAAGYALVPGMAMGHRRLSIIDPELGQQPIVSDDQSLYIVYNGEIYNYREIRQRLIELGCQFHSQCDSEVLLKAWQTWGEDTPAKLRGMFAFVIWDKAQDVLYCVRDRLGIKPLYYAQVDDTLVVASELKAFFPLADMQWTICPQALEDYFSLGYVIEPKTIYQQIYKVMPGSMLKVQRHSLAAPQSIVYWDILDFVEAKPDVIAPEQVRELFAGSVTYHMVADVEVGAFLSGGLDSSAIVSMMSPQHERPIHTCSIGFDQKSYDESGYAERVAKHFNTLHHQLTLGEQGIELVDELVATFDEPFADNSAIPTFALSELAARRVKVILSGDGSDELFVGYRNYKMLAFEQWLAEKIPVWVKNSLIPRLAKWYPKLDWAPRFMRAKTTLESLSRSPIESYHQAMSIADEKTLRDLYSPALMQQLNRYRSRDAFIDIAEKVSVADPIKMAQLIDFKTYLPGDILTKLDRTTMAHSVEARVPFLDHVLVEQMISQPTPYNMQGDELQKTLVSAMKNDLPEFVLKREKMGFTSPLDEWFRQLPLASLRDRVLSSRMQLSGFFESAALEQIINWHRAKKRHYGPLLWALIVFDAFLSQHEKRQHNATYRL